MRMIFFFFLPAAVLFCCLQSKDLDKDSFSDSYLNFNSPHDFTRFCVFKTFIIEDKFESGYL